MQFATNLKVVRSARGLVSEDVCREAGLRNKKRCADIEGLRGDPTEEEMRAICKVLDVSTDEMLSKTAVITIHFK